MTSPLSSLRTQARAAASQAHVPFSGKGAAAVLLLSDGTWVPGVRVESASFSLAIAPALNAYTTAVAAGRRDVVAAGFSQPPTDTERTLLKGLGVGPFHAESEDAFVAQGASVPVPRARLDPHLQENLPGDPASGVALARTVAERALVPASRFPVGCVLEAGGVLVPGVNVEPHADAASVDWTHVLCAERNALGTACTYGLLGTAAASPDGEARNQTPKTLYLSCPKDAGCSPCGACRQLLVELLPHGVLWMDRTPEPPERARPPGLLPGSFQGTALSCGAPGA